jgi:hypothetical protein
MPYRARLRKVCQRQRWAISSESSLIFCFLNFLDSALFLIRLRKCRLNGIIKAAWLRRPTRDSRSVIVVRPSASMREITSLCQAKVNQRDGVLLGLGVSVSDRILGQRPESVGSFSSNDATKKVRGEGAIIPDSRREAKVVNAFPSAGINKLCVSGLPATTSVISLMLSLLRLSKSARSLSAARKAGEFSLSSSDRR